MYQLIGSFLSTTGVILKRRKVFNRLNFRINPINILVPRCVTFQQLNDTKHIEGGGGMLELMAQFFHKLSVYLIYNSVVATFTCQATMKSFTVLKQSMSLTVSLQTLVNY